jgi:hypothetical protein
MVVLMENFDNTIIEGYRRRGRRGRHYANYQQRQRERETAHLNELRRQNGQLIRQRNNAYSTNNRLSGTRRNKEGERNHYVRDNARLDSTKASMSNTITSLGDDKVELEDEIPSLELTRENSELDYRNALVSKGINESALGTSIGAIMTTMYNAKWFDAIDNTQKGFSYNRLAKQNEQLEKTTNRMDSENSSDGRKSYYEYQRRVGFQLLNNFLLIIFFILWVVLAYVYFTLRYDRTLFSMLFVLLPLIVLPFWLYIWEYAIYYTKNMYV